MEAKTNSRRHPNVQALRNTVSNTWGDVLKASKVKEVCSKVIERMEKIVATEGGQVM